MVVNPWLEMPLLYGRKMRAHFACATSSAADVQPHVYSIARAAYEGIDSASGTSQSILITYGTGDSAVK